MNKRRRRRQNFVAQWNLLDSNVICLGAGYASSTQLIFIIFIIHSLSHFLYDFLYRIAHKMILKNALNTKFAV